MRIPAAFDALGDRDYRLLWLGAVTSLTSAQMRQIANGYLAFELTGSAAVLALVMLSQSLPSFFLSMFGGVIADRVKRRALLIFTQSCILLDSTIAATLVLTGLIEVWQLACLGVFHGSVLAFNQPSRQAYMVELAGPAKVTQAIALYSAGQTAVRIIAPSFAGALIGLSFIGVDGVFVAVAVVYTLPVLSLLLINARPEGAPRQRRPILTEFKAGIRYIQNHEVLRVLIIVGLIPPLLGNHYQNFLPVFASEEVLDVGGSGLGLMATCTGIGAFLGAMVVASFGNIPRRGLVQLGAGALFGLTLVLFGLASSLPLVLVALVAVGFAFALYQTLNSTLTLASTDPEYYGRVSSVQQINFSLAAFLLVPIGVLVDEFGAPSIMVVSGALIMVFWALVGVFFAGYRRIELPQLMASEAEPSPASGA